MSDIMPGQPGDTNTSAREKVHDTLWWATPGSSDAESKQRAAAMLDDYRAEVARETRAKTLTEVADMLMAADETAAALLVDRLRDGGQR